MLSPVGNNVQVLVKNEPEPLIRLNVIVPVGDEPATIAMHGVGGPSTTNGGQLSEMDEDAVVAVDVIVVVVDVVVVAVVVVVDVDCGT